MILRTQCPNCQSTYRLRTPPPPEGRKYRCTCGTVITIAYPEQVREVLRSKGFEVAPESGTETLPLEEGAECNGTSDDQLQSADEMETLVDVPAAGRGTGTDTADTAGMQAQSASEVQDKPPAADRTSAPTSRSSGPSPSKEEELLRMNIVGDGGAGLTRPPRLDPLPAGSPSRRSPLDSGSVSALLAEHEDSPGIPREDSPRDDLTSPSELTDLPPLAETSSLRTPPEDRSGEAPPLEGESRPAADSAGEPEPRSPDPVGSVPSIPEPMTSGTGGDSFLPPAGDLPDPPNEAPAPPEEADGNFWAGPTPKDEAGAAASDETEEGLPAETPAPAWSGQSAFDRKPASAKKAPGKQKRTRKKVRTGPGARVFLVFKRVALIIAVMTLVAALFFLSIIGYYSRDLPSVESLATYNPPTVSQVYSEDGQLLGEFFDEQRYVVPLDEIPKHVQDAFVAAEDAAFWEHKGLDYRGILRAMLRNVEEGRMAQGASTITQQVARTFLLTSDKKLARKIKEAILAHRVENNFSKEHILFLYLNQISFGGGGRGKQAFGVQAASTLYFGKNAQDLSLAEGSILAGLPQAPSRYSPTRGPDHFRKAKQRQLYVLEQMADKGYITREQASDAFDQELTFKKKRNKNLDIAPYYVEHVRRYLVETYGEEAVNNQGLQVTVPIDVSLQLVAAQAVKDGVRRSDKIMGYRGPIVHHEKEADRVRARRAIDRSRTLASRPFDPRFSLPEGPVDASLLPPLKEGEISRGVVTKVGKTWALVDIGSHRGLLPVKEFSWCHKEDNTKSFRYFVCKSLDDTLFPGDEIEVRVLNTKESWKKTLGVGWKGPTEFARLSMEQPPKPQAALVNMRVT
ncbi:MAG: transglycosylase domain-containing protein, partial [Myxococcota bacterium]|nr:transglycosylase domain-containing protein [Myxococcota bacterium]